MLIKLSWRNIWRNKRRSQIVVISIIVGVVAIILMDTLSMGMIRQMLENQIGSHVGHIQIHRNGFNDNKIIQNYLPDADEVEEVLKSTPEVIAFSERVLTLGLLSSATNSSGVFLVGIHPEEERNITTINGSIVKGNYLSGHKREIVIGEKLAEILGVELGDKVVAMASALDGTIGSDVFRVVGLYQTLSSEFDKTYIYIPIQNSQKMLDLAGHISEYVFLVENTKEVQDVKLSIKNHLGEKYEVLSYRDLLPTLVMYMDLYKQTIWIFYLIIAIAMVFGIVNTMLMSVFERIQEFGVLMAMGMKNGKLFTMILMEAFFLGVFGTIVGVLIGLIIYFPLTQSGIDFSTFSEGLTAMGSGAIIFPILTFQGFLSALVIVPFVSVIGAIYPAIRTVRLQPVSAIRYV